jgi:hypothetical protein
MLAAATVLVVLAGIPLLFAPTTTEAWFAWTVQPPLSAAALGAAYWASAIVQASALRARQWVEARVAVPGVLVFTVLTLLVTLLHLDRFHLTADVAPATRAIAWLWLAVYACVPVLLIVAWRQQRRVPGQDPPAAVPLPRGVVMAVLVVSPGLFVVGVTLLVQPAVVASLWPWDLTPLTGRAFGAWCVGLAVSGGAVLREADAVRARPVALGAVALPVLLGVVLLIHRTDLLAVRWLVLVGVLLVWAAAGWSILLAARRADVSA